MFLKINLKVLLLSFFILLFSIVGAGNVTVELGSAPSKLYVLSYYGKGVQVVDSLVMCNGVGVWQRNEDVFQGVYSLAESPSSNRFDFLMGDNQDFKIELKSLDSKLNNISGSQQSEAFLSYQNIVFDASKTKAEKIAYTQLAYLKAAEGSMLKLVLQAMLPVPTNDAFVSPLVVNDESDYEALHFWDNFDLSDKRLVRTPFFAPHVEMYLRQVLLPREDKIMAGMLPLFAKVEGEDELLKVVVSSALTFSIENTIMGIDALGYEVITRYYLSGRFGELPLKQKKMLDDYVRHTEYSRVGNQAKEVRLDALEQERGEVSLYELKAPFVLVLFWEPDCDYCKVVLPALQQKIMGKYYDKGLRIFAVNTQRDYTLWKNYILDHELVDWVHGYKAMGESSFMVDYGVQGTPFMFLLDKDKKILAKNVKLEHLDMMLDRLFATGSIY